MLAGGCARGGAVLGGAAGAWEGERDRIWMFTARFGISWILLVSERLEFLDFWTREIRGISIPVLPPDRYFRMDTSPALPCTRGVFDDRPAPRPFNSPTTRPR